MGLVWVEDIFWLSLFCILLCYIISCELILVGLVSFRCLLLPVKCQLWYDLWSQFTWNRYVHGAYLRICGLKLIYLQYLFIISIWDWYFLWLQKLLVECQILCLFMVEKCNSPWSSSLNLGSSVFEVVHIRCCQIIRCLGYWFWFCLLLHSPVGVWWSIFYLSEFYLSVLLFGFLWILLNKYETSVFILVILVKH